MFDVANQQSPITDSLKLKPGIRSMSEKDDLKIQEKDCHRELSPAMRSQSLGLPRHHIVM